MSWISQLVGNLVGAAHTAGWFGKTLSVKDRSAGGKSEPESLRFDDTGANVAEQTEQRERLSRAEMKSCPVVKMRRVGAIDPPVGGWLGLGTGVDGSLCVLHASDESSQRGLVSTAEIARYTPDGASDRVGVVGLHLRWPTVQPLPDGGFLLVGSRDPSPNAVVVDDEGEIVDWFAVGDAVEHVQVMPSGGIAVGYFDEGITIGVNGIARFSGSGEREWDYQPPEGFEPVVDCYALTTSGEDTWACYYRQFPIVRIDSDGHATAWANSSISGAKHLLVDGGTIGLVGGYGPHEERLAVGRLNDSTRALEDVKIYRLALPDGEPIPLANMTSRGGILHAVVGTNWYALRIDAIAVNQ